MAVRDDAEFLRHRERRIVAAVVDEQNAVDDVVRDGRVALRECLLGPIRGHDDSDAVSVQHAIESVQAPGEAPRSYKRPAGAADAARASAPSNA